MKYMKFKATNIFTGTEILPADNVLITDEQGVIESIVDITDAGEEVIVLDGMLSPGFVNTHCHLELSHMKGRIEPGSGLVEFLIRVIKERNFSSGSMQDAMKFADLELYNGGTVAAADICNTANSAGIKQASKIRWRNFIEVLGFNDDNATDRLNFAKKIQDEFTTPTSLSPHAPYSVSSTLFRLINEASAGEIITVHNQETAAENELYMNRQGDFFELYRNLSIDPASFKASGKTSLQTYLPWLNKASDLLLVHNTCIHEQDILFAKELTGTAINLFFCICINANKYITSQVPPLDLFRKHNCQLTIGTDSYASNHQLNMLEEIKAIHHEFAHIPLDETLRWATLNSARALKMDDTLGSFAKGKQPGIVLISNVVDQKLTDQSSAIRIL